MVQRVLDKGEWKSPVRKVGNSWEPVDGGIRTKACPNVFFSHEMSDGFPLLTTKKMAWKAIRVELEGFIRGITEKDWFQSRGCKIWDEWGNPEKVSQIMKEWEAKYPNASPQEKLEAKKWFQQTENDLGTIYGYQWRHFGENYNFDDWGKPGWYKGDDNLLSYPDLDKMDGLVKGTDQLANIVETLRTNPMDRRMVCSAWNPNQMHMMALPPCHYAWNVTVINNKVNLFWAQRSADLMLGVPFNIASYGLLLTLLARDANLEVGNLSACFVDCHIYENQLDGAYEQVKRTPQPLPTIVIEDNIQNLVAPDEFNIFHWEYKDVELQNYNPLDKIDFGKVAV